MPKKRTKPPEPIRPTGETWPAGELAKLIEEGKRRKKAEELIFPDWWPDSSEPTEH